jgi:hypothetical protein
LGYKKGRYLKFNKERYKLFDSPGKEAVAAHLNVEGLYTLPQENYMADIKALEVAERSGKVIEAEIQFHEVEIKNGWRGSWPKKFKDVRIPYRKKKLVDKYEDQVFYFWVVSGDLQSAWKIPSSAAKEEYVQECSNYYFPEGEKFFCIPVEEAELIDLKTPKGEAKNG